MSTKTIYDAHIVFSQNVFFSISDRKYGDYHSLTHSHYSFSLLFIRLFVHSFVLHSFIQSSIRSSFHSFIHSFIHSFTHSFIHSFNCLFAFLHVCFFFHFLFVRLFVHILNNNLLQVITLMLNMIYVTVSRVILSEEINRFM